MKKLPFILTFVLTVQLALAQPSDVIRNYIAAYRDIAVEEMLRTGVPASITLAQGIHETGAGQSVLVKKSNNHFGIKCKSEWKGEAVYHDDDERGECFRKYDDPMDSYRDHSDFLKNRSHYGFLFRLDPMDYEGWAHGLKKAGYATNPRYPQILIKLIRDFHLQDYTMLALERKKNGEGIVLVSNVQSESSSEAKQGAPIATTTRYPSGIFEINNCKVIMATRGTSYLKIAEEQDLSLPKLFDYNDMDAADIVPFDQILFLQRKKKKGSSAFHIVTPGETLQDIAQREGIRLEYLLEYNGLRKGMMPKVGEKLYLQEEAPSMPRLVSDFEAQTAVVREKSETREKPAGSTVHTVQPKETLYAIARRYDVTVDEVMKWNDMQNTELKIGQQLRINKRTGNAN